MATLWAGASLRVGDLTLVPVEHTGIRSDTSGTGCWMAAVKEPFAIVVCDGSGVRAFAMDSSELALDTLIADIPNLADILAELSAL